MEGVTNSEGKLLSQFRKQIQDVELSKELSEDKNLVRWIRARNTLKESEKMFREHIEWRKRKDMDGMNAEYDLKSQLGPEWDEHYSFYLYGLNSEGCPVILVSGRSWDIERAIKAGMKKEIGRHILALSERIWRVCLKNSIGKDYIPQIIDIYDLGGVSLSLFNSREALNTILDVAREFEANYPDSMRHVFILNAPWIFQILWTLLRQIMTEKTQEKISFLGSNPDIWREEISKFVSFQQFPKMYGGDGDDNAKMGITSDGNLIEIPF